MAQSPSESTLSNRGAELIGKPLRDDFELFHDAEQNAYHPDDNPDGAISLCIAENVLSWPDMRERLVSASAKTPPVWVAKYTDVRGAPEFREALAGFAERRITTLGNQRAQPLNPDCFCVSSGATAIVELTALLLGDSGDVAAFPAPCYPVYRQDVGHKAKLERYDIEPATPWEDVEPGVHPLSVADLDRSLADIQQQGKRLRLLVLTQPDNPTGAIYTAEQLRDFSAWSIAHEVHLCVNELYALSQVDTKDARIAADYPEQPTPYSSFLHELELRQSAYLHWWYSFSKDFGISGLRCGVMYTRNADLLEAFGNYAAPHTVSNHTQWLLTQVLNDDAWVEAFAKTNQARLTDSYAAVVTALRERNIGYRVARGSLFVWAKFNTGEGSDEAFWRKLYDEHRVLLTSPGGFGQEEDGWLRLVYSCVETKALDAALGRFL